ncbi:Mycobacterium numidiamassiliense ORFan [Mycobacterium numidiamassiliense]|uniref:Mycobacterium numidiamassiliense ORFan n=1 Tax=Mycobacterium numidiamassiliense TaxID=1841861 RepID=A0A2U3PHM1_9MYCO|nr:Mycobacterium numidiamassiliense ORFan [Mycobacterium numidiamassiliense]
MTFNEGMQIDTSTASSSGGGGGMGMAIGLDDIIYDFLQYPVGI